MYDECERNELSENELRSKYYIVLTEKQRTIKGPSLIDLGRCCGLALQ